MTNLADVLGSLLGEQPGLTASELYASLGRWKSQVRSELYVAACLEREKGRFTPDRLTGGWYLIGSRVEALRPDDQAPDSTSAPAVAHVLAPTAIAPVLAPTDCAAEEDDPTSVDSELRGRLRGRRVVAEVGLDAATHERVEAALQRLMLRTRDLSRISAIHPALLATYLVGHGVYRYEAGNFYGTTSLRGIDQAAGPAFASAIRRLGLETFEDLVIGDNALRYVGPILAHGGIPKYCLDDYFSLLLRDMERVDGDAAELLSFWRTRKSAFFGIDVPVRRFLLYGGELARDVVDRCIDMIRQHTRTGRIPRPADLGLPPYIVAAFANRQEKTPTQRARGRLRVARPAVSLDPWGGTGPQLLLPPVPVGSTASWRVVADGLLERIRASPYETRHVRLNPAKAWTVDLTDGQSVLRARTSISRAIRVAVD